MRYGQAVLAAAAVIGLAGCGSSAGTGAAGTATAGTATGGTGAGGVSSPAAAAFPAATRSASAAVGTGGFVASCPSTAMVSSALGQTYPAPKELSGNGTVSCTYNNGTDVLVVLFTPTAGVNGADLKIAMDSQAKGQQTTDHSVSGLGDAAYEFSSTASGSLQTIVAVQAHSVDIDLTTQASAAQTQALARDILGS
ncbi:MAG TPA: hypothetical protein VGG16_29845 [Streptosporangiaceae bacterium]|jgi:hypothetical protein